jgi:hypothetical protein
MRFESLVEVTIDIVVFIYITDKIFFARSRIAQSVQRWATGWKTGVRFQVEEEIFLYLTAWGPDLGHTQPPIQWAQ